MTRQLTTVRTKDVDALVRRFEGITDSSFADWSAHEDLVARGLAEDAAAALSALDSCVVGAMQASLDGTDPPTAAAARDQAVYLRYLVELLCDVRL